MIKQSTFLRRAIRAVLATGWELYAVNGKRVSTVSGAMDEARAVDLCDIDFVNEDNRAWITIVWQGPDDTYPEGQEIVADYSMKLDEILAPLYDAADKADKA